MLWEKIAPSTAMPVAIPTCRNVAFTPDAMPARSGSTTATAVDASGTLTSPAPTPATTRPASRAVQSDAGVRPCISSSPIPIRRNPGPISSRVGTRADRRPATPAVRKIAPVSGRNRMPASIAE